MVLNAALGEYYGIQGTTWQHPPILGSPSFSRIGQRQAAARLQQRRQGVAGRLAHPAGRLLGLEHAHRHPLKPADDRDRGSLDRGVSAPSAARRPASLASRRYGLGARTRCGDRHRLRRAGHGRRLCRARQRGVVRRHRRRQDRAPRDGRDPDLRARAGGVRGPQPRAPALLHRARRRRSSMRGCCSSLSGRRRPTPAMRTCRRSSRSWRAMPASDRHALVMKSTVPVGTGAAIKRTLRRCRARPASRTCPAPSS